MLNQKKSGAFGIHFKKHSNLPNYNISLEGHWINDKLGLARIWGKMSPSPCGRIITDWFMLSTRSYMDTDYRIIVNSPPQYGLSSKFPLNKTISLRMEPDNVLNPRWNFWYGDYNKKDFCIFAEKEHDKKYISTEAYDEDYVNTFLNNCEWHLGKSYPTLMRELKAPDNKGSRKIASNAGGPMIGIVMSSLYYMPGHRYRVDLIRRLEEMGVMMHIYGKDNGRGFKQYMGTLPAYTKEAGIEPYYYTLHAENIKISNYITEKLYDAILCETLCFYNGDNTVEDYINPLAFYRLPDDIQESANLIKTLSADKALWESRYKYIMEAKTRILVSYSFYSRMTGFIGFNQVHFIFEDWDTELANRSARNLFIKNYSTYSTKTDGELVEFLERRVSDYENRCFCYIPKKTGFYPNFTDKLSRAIADLIADKKIYSSIENWDVCDLTGKVVKEESNKYVSSVGKLSEPFCESSPRLIAPGSISKKKIKLCSTVEPLCYV